MEDYKHDGSFLLPTRYIENIERIIGLPRSENRIPTNNELSEFLNFLSIYALSTSFKYDSTIPDDFVSDLTSSAEALNIESHIAPLEKTVGDDFSFDIENSVYMASPQIEKYFKKPLKSFKEIKEDKIDTFYGYIKRLNKENNTSRRIDLGHDAFNSGTMGGKLLLGLAAEKNNQLLKSVANVEKEGLSMKEDFMSSMIQSFRFSLLSSWAGRKNSIFYSPFQEFNLIDTYRSHIWQEMEELFKKRKIINTVQFDDDISADSYSNRFPIIGLVILYNADKKSRPEDLISDAKEFGLKYRLDKLEKDLMAQNKRIEGDREFEDLADYIWKKINDEGGFRRKDNPELLKKATHFFTPFFTTSSTRAILEGVENFQDLEQILTGGAIVGGVMSFQMLLKELYKYRKEKCESYIATMSHIMSYGEELQQEAIQRKVESIWRFN